MSLVLCIALIPVASTARAADVLVSNDAQRLQILAVDALGPAHKLTFPKPQFDRATVESISFVLLKSNPETDKRVPFTPDQQTVNRRITESSKSIQVELGLDSPDDANEKLWLEIVVKGKSLLINRCKLKFILQPVAGHGHVRAWLDVTLTNRTGLPWPKGTAVKVQWEKEPEFEFVPLGSILRAGEQRLATVKTATNIPVSIGVKLDKLQPPDLKVSSTLAPASVALSTLKIPKWPSFLKGIPISQIAVGVHEDQWRDVLLPNQGQRKQLEDGENVPIGPIPGTGVTVRSVQTVDLQGISAGRLYYRRLWPLNLAFTSSEDFSDDGARQELVSAVRALASGGWKLTGNGIAIEEIAGATNPTAVNLSAVLERDSQESLSLRPVDQGLLRSLGRGEALIAQSLRLDLGPFKDMSWQLQFLSNRQNIMDNDDSSESVRNALGSLRCKLESWIDKASKLQGEAKSWKQRQDRGEPIPADCLTDIEKLGAEVEQGFSAYESYVLSVKLPPEEFKVNQIPPAPTAKPCPDVSRP